MIETEEIDVDRIIFRSESHDHLKSSLNEPTTRDWRLTWPDACNQNQILLLSVKVTDWSEITSRKVFRTFFSEDKETRNPVSVNMERYVSNLEQLFPKDSQEICPETVFQQDGEILHTYEVPMIRMNNRFSRQINFIKKPQLFWPPRASDLKAEDFYDGDAWKQKIEKQIYKHW